jgi:hypothetical protein
VPRKTICREARDFTKPTERASNHAPSPVNMRLPEGQWPSGQVHPLHISQQVKDDCWIFDLENVTNQLAVFFLLMTENCHVPGCKHDVPAPLAEQKMCVLHFTLSLEGTCAEMRRETALGNAPYTRQREIMGYITENGERLARVATSGLHMTDDLKARVLSTFLTLMNLRENLDRAALRTPVGRGGLLR